MAPVVGAGPGMVEGREPLWMMAWRVVATGLSFAVFGLGGLVLWAFAFPWIRWRHRRSPERRKEQSRQLIQSSFAAFIELMRCLGVLTYEIHGAHKLQRRGLLVLANHPTLIDVVFLISRIPNADCVVRKGLFSNPFTAGPVKAADYISNGGGPELIEDCIRSIKHGGNLVIFPEGTRTRPGVPISLQRGAANIAVRGRIDITPVSICCDPPTLSKGLPWYKVPTRRFHVTIRVHDDMAVTPFLSEGQGEAMQARIVTSALRRILFEEELNGQSGPTDQGIDHRIAGS